MKRYNPGDKVRVIVKGHEYSGTINSHTNFYSAMDQTIYYLVDYDVDDRKECTIFSEADLDAWAAGKLFNTQCTCGAWSVGVLDKEVSRHSWHCKITKDAEVPEFDFFD